MTSETVVFLQILKYCINPSQSLVYLPNPIIVSMSAADTNRIFSLCVHYAKQTVFPLFL